MKNLPKREVSSLISGGYTRFNNKKLDTVSSFYDFYANADGEIIRLERFSGKGVLYSSLLEALNAMGLNSNTNYVHNPIQTLYDCSLNEHLDHYVSKLYELLNISSGNSLNVGFHSLKEISTEMLKINFYENFDLFYVPIVAFISKVLINETNGFVVLNFDNKRDFLIKNKETFFNPYRNLFKLYSEQKNRLNLEALILSEYHTA